MKTGLSYKKADKLIYGAVKNLTCILPQEDDDVCLWISCNFNIVKFFIF